MKLAFRYLQNLVHNRLSQIVLFVTYRCPANCPFCFLGDMLNRPGELGLADYEKLAQNLKNLRLFQITVTGGEPFLRADLAQLVELLHRVAGIPLVSLPTSGWNAGVIAGAMTEISRRCPSLTCNVSLSLEGEKEVHDRARGKEGSFDSVMETYRALEPLAQSGNINLLISTTLGDDNVEHVDRFCQWIKREMPAVSSLLLHPQRDAQSRRMEKQKQEKFRQAILQAREHDYLCRFANGLERRFVRGVLDGGYAGIARTWREQRRIIPCLAGRKLVVITPEGTVYPCEPLWFYPEAIFPDAGKGYCLGRLPDFDFDLGALLAEADSRRSVAEIHRRRCFCDYPCALLNGLYFRPLRSLALATKARSTLSKSR